MKRYSGRTGLEIPDDRDDGAMGTKAVRTFDGIDWAAKFAELYPHVVAREPPEREPPREEPQEPEIPADVARLLEGRRSVALSLEGAINGQVRTYLEGRLWVLDESLKAAGWEP